LGHRLTLIAGKRQRTKRLEKCASKRDARIANSSAGALRMLKNGAEILRGATRFIFGPSTWLRGLIKPEPGRAVAYVDWSQQEFGIAASLSGDRAMMEAYRSGDPYLTFGQQAGQIPPNGTKKTHGADRELFKACVLGVQYGMGPEALARRIGKPTAYGRELLQLHHETYPAFWRWSDGAESYAMLLNRLHTVFGWTVRVGPDANPRSLRNFPCQANGAEMMRLACCLATE
jgi:DNA polymerase I